jgi:hypothetical protein
VPETAKFHRRRLCSGQNAWCCVQQFMRSGIALKGALNGAQSDT